MVFCGCGKQAIILTSWTSKNPGRRFYACPNQGSKCKFIGWFDPAMCQRATDIIPGLLRSKNKLEAEILHKDGELKKFKFLLVIASIVIVFLVALLVV